MPRFLFALVALISLSGCGNAKKNDFETEMKFYREAESALLVDGCTLEEKSADDITLDCSAISSVNGRSDLSSDLIGYVTRGASALEKDAAGEKKFLSDDERLRIQRKISLANKIRGVLSK